MNDGQRIAAFSYAIITSGEFAMRRSGRIYEFFFAVCATLLLLVIVDSLCDAIRGDK